MNIIILLGLGLIIVMTIVLAVLIISNRGYKILLHLKEPVNNNFLYHKRKAKLMKDADGQEFYKTSKKINQKKYFPLPEDNKSTHIDPKGNKHVFGYVDQHGEVVWAIDTNTDLFTNEEFLKKIQPFTSNQRAFYINQERKAQEDSGFNWKQNLPIIVSGVVLIVVLVIAMVIFKNLYQDNQKLAEQNLKITENQLEIINTYQSINSGIQEIKNELNEPDKEGVATP